MTPNRLISHQPPKTVNEESHLEQSNSEIISTLSKNRKNQKMVPVQFYMTNDMKKRLKLYCLSNDTKMTDVLNTMVNEFLTSNGF